jgi:hypothetical protein
MLKLVVIASTFTACVPPSTSPGVVYYVPVVPIVPLHAYPPAPYPVEPEPVPTVEFVTPSLAVRNLAMKISESASEGDCATAKAAGNELEKIDHESHHALIAVDARYAGCIRGF